MPDLIPAALNDFLHISRDKIWTWRTIPFFVLNADGEHEQYAIDERWNDRIVIEPDSLVTDEKKRMFIEFKGIGLSKGAELCRFIDAGICFINIKDKFVKPPTARDIKNNIKNKFITGKVDF